MNETTPEDTTSIIIARGLQMLFDGVRPQGRSYLIVSSAHAYMQFSRDWGDASMQAEAVSNLYLANARQLDQAAINTMHDRGFEDPGVEISPDQCRSATTATEIAGGAPARSPNYFRYFDVSTPDKVAALADLVVEVLSTVYGVDPQAPLKLQLTLGDAVATNAEPVLSTEQSTPSVDEPAWAKWSIRLSPGAEPVIYETVSGEAIATVHGSDQAFRRALLLQRAPDLLEAVRAVEAVFALVADGHLELDPATASELLPALQATLELLDDQETSARRPQHCDNQAKKIRAYHSCPNLTARPPTPAQLLRQIEDSIEAVRNSEQLQAYLRAAARFHHYSLRNVLLIATQRPEATRVASFHRRLKLGRYVPKGKHGIRILAPCVARKAAAEGDEDAVTAPLFYKAVSVFDISQNDGEELPSPVRLLEGNDAGLFASFARVAASEGLSLSRHKQALSANGYYAPAERKIRVSPELTPLMSSKTLAHPSNRRSPGQRET